jgi:hypothetical protein
VAAEQGAAAGVEFKGGGRLGFEVQADGGDLRHPCLGPHDTHLGGASAVGVAATGVVGAAPAAPRCRHGKEKQRGRKRNRDGRLTCGVHLAVTQRSGRWWIGFGGLKGKGRPAGKAGGASVDLTSWVKAQQRYRLSYF